jgi:DNA polymerase-4
MGEERTIFHIDMDAFFAAVEVMANPSLAGKPLIVCGDPERRSVVSTASYEARKFGVRSGMAITEARRLCPGGVFLRGNPEKYVHTSVRILNLFKEFTDRVEPFSIDEAFLDLSETSRDAGSPEAIGRRIKGKVWSEVGLSCSVGIGPNKLIAKMASSLQKPDGLSLVRGETYLEVFGGKTVSTLWGVGEKIERELNRMGIRTIADLAAFPEEELVRAFGVEGERLHHASNGRDDTPVLPYYQGIEAKSLGHEHTLPRDVAEREELEAVILRLSDQVARRMRAHRYRGRTVTLKIRASDFQTRTRQRVLSGYTDEERTVFSVARALFRANWKGEKVRLLGVSVSNLVRWSGGPQPFLFDEDRRHRDLLEAVDRVRDTFGENALTRARLVG